MIVLNAGYIIDEILGIFADKQKFLEFVQKKCCFSVDKIDFISYPIDKPEPIFSVIHNLISRGTPTRASKFLEEIYMKKIKMPTDLLDTTNIPQEIEIILDDLIRIGKVQKIISLFFISNKNNSNNNIVKFFVNSKDKDIVSIAIEDLKRWFTIIHTLLESTNLFPHIEVTSDTNLAFDLAISFENIDLQDINSKYKIIISQNAEGSIQSKFVTTAKIVYKNLGEVSKDSNTFVFNDLEKEKALEYVLQSVFGKEKFRAGQIAIINRVLQGKDVIGLLPTGGGKSLTFQLAGLLQPAMTIVIDPINSLMRDQYEKLIENYIDAALYINSYNTPNDREKNEEKLQNAEVLFCFVSPERLQIKRFRDRLKNCKDKGTYFGYAVIDEAHCVSEWGHDFRQTYLRLGTNLKEFCPVKDGKLTLFGLTATASYDVLADIQRELEMEDDAIQSLPAEQIDRKELTFNLVKVKDTGINIAWKREKGLGKEKYIKIKQILKEIPNKLNISNFYDKNEKGLYTHSGIIFCPTKSDTLGNGVLALKNGYNNGTESIEGIGKLDFLEIVTFFSSQDDNLAGNELVDSEAKLSFENQGKFIQNETNLMIATKAFGMGIDKPNIRYTIHYSLPSSVESFYQEAGRAGRDRQPALSSILYCAEDELTNLEFLKNSFKGFEREKVILTELLEEVEYEDKFYLNYLTSILNEEFRLRFNLYITNHNELEIKTQRTNWGRDAYRNLLPDPNIVTFGWLHLDDLTATPLLATPHSTNVLALAKSFIQKFCPNTNYADWLKQTQKAGLETLLNTKEANNCLIIGFNNKKITEIKDLLLKENIIQKVENPTEMEGGNIWNKDDTERFIRAAYNFCWSETEFVNEKLPYEYKRLTGNGFPKLSEALEDKIKKFFWQIRIAPDTHKAVYRLIILGVVDDYTIDYSGKAVVAYFSSKTEEQYKDNFSAYLKRYVGEDTKNEWIKKANTDYANESPLRRYLFTLAEFVEEIICKKRENAIKYVKDLCEESINSGNPNVYFREDIVLYFTSKFAKTAGIGSLTADTKKGTEENFEIVKTYIDYIWNAPDGLGDQISNTKHLKAACARMKSSTGFDNATIDLLSSFTNFATEVQKESDLSNFEESLLINEAKDLYIKGFERFEKKYSFRDWVNNIEHFNEKLQAISPILLLTIEKLQSQLIFKNQKKWLSQFNQNFIDI